MGTYSLCSLCRDNLNQWEKIACGEAEDIVIKEPSRPSAEDSGPVKVDNWLPKGCWTTKGVQPESCHRPMKTQSVLAADDKAKFNLTLKTHSNLIRWRRCQRWRLHRSQRLTDGQLQERCPLSWGTHLVERTVGVFIPLLFCVILWFCFFFLWAVSLVVLHFRGLNSEPFTGLDLWNCVVGSGFLKWYCLPSVVRLEVAYYFSKVFPVTEGMCRRKVAWCDATLLKRCM